MGKKQHQKDKLYITCTEWSTQYGGKKTEGPKKFKRLPFNCCSISLLPFKNPYCTKEGAIFDLENVLPFLKKFGVNPVTGKKMTSKELIRLNFHKNKDDHYHCPVTFKVFNENTHIVAIITTGNVYSYDAIDRLNLKPNLMNDLLDNSSFTRKDIITLQDPTQLEKFNISAFYHVQNNLRLKDPSSSENLRSANIETRETLSELEKTYKPSELLNTNKSTTTRIRDEFNTAHYSTGAAAASFTSTVMEPVTTVEPAILEDDVVRYSRIKKKGYVRLVTNFGPLNLELYCDALPKTCENFIGHCKSGYYHNTSFHRLIRHFVLQGGDPSGTGHGGESIWGEAFADEFTNYLSHDGRGVLSMANSGPNTNKSQFFITFRSCKHLDGKHCIFGKIVGGLETLDAIEKVETDKNDKPIEEVKILSTQVFVDPYQEADDELTKQRLNKKDQLENGTLMSEQMASVQPRNRREQEALVSAKQTAKLAAIEQPKVVRSGVGKFLSADIIKRASTEESHLPHKKKKTVRNTLDDFSAW